MTRAETLAGLTEAIAGHVLEEHAAGNGYTEPREAWAVCTCGADIAEWQQFYNESDYDPERDFPAHVAAVALAWLEGHGWGPLGSQANRALLDESWAPVETGEKL